jgi:hypothetical protein
VQDDRSYRRFGRIYCPAVCRAESEQGPCAVSSGWRAERAGTRPVHMRVVTFYFHDANKKRGSWFEGRAGSARCPANRNGRLVSKTQGRTEKKNILSFLKFHSFRVFLTSWLPASKASVMCFMRFCTNCTSKGTLRMSLRSRVPFLHDGFRRNLVLGVCTESVRLLRNLW